jgi:hypothetical protein
VKGRAESSPSAPLFAVIESQEALIGGEYLIQTWVALLVALALTVPCCFPLPQRKPHQLQCRARRGAEPRCFLPVLYDLSRVLLHPPRIIERMTACGGRRGRRRAASGPTVTSSEGAEGAEGTEGTSR